jgi:hypothetical protein
LHILNRRSLRVIASIQTLMAIALLSMLCDFGKGDAMDRVYPVPKDRAEVKGSDWFPHVVSKLAPLEWWSYQESIDDVKREVYSSDWSFQLARQNTWEFPRFCFIMFRPSGETYVGLLRAVEQYQGAVTWLVHDNCVGAWASKGGFPRRYFHVATGGEIDKTGEGFALDPPKSDPALVQKAVADIPALCTYLEQRLALTDKIPIDFDSAWLTRQRLAQLRGEFEDFFEPGTWDVYLALKPKIYAKLFQPTSTADRPLGFGVDLSEQETLFDELEAQSNNRTAQRQEKTTLPEYPLLSRLVDIASDAIYQPKEVHSLLAEYLRAQQVVTKQKSIRGLDKLIRIAKWAEKLKVGIYFGGQ